MKTVTYEEFLDFGPCWLGTEEGRKRLRKYKAWWGDGKTVLDILSLEKVDAKDRLWTVLRSEFVEDNILHEFACRCAERALSRIDNPDQRSIAAIEAKRAWLRGKISDDELYAAWDAAWDAARDAARDATQDAAWGADWVAAWVAAWSVEEYAVQSATLSTAQFTARGIAEYAAWPAAQFAAWDAAQSSAWGAAQSSARSAAQSAAKSAVGNAAQSAAKDAARREERQWQVEELMRTIKEAK